MGLPPAQGDIPGKATAPEQAKEEEQGQKQEEMRAERTSKGHGIRSQLPGEGSGTTARGTATHLSPLPPHRLRSMVLQGGTSPGRAGAGTTHPAQTCPADTREERRQPPAPAWTSAPGPE